MTATLVSSKLHRMSGRTSAAGNQVMSQYYVDVTEATTPQRVIDLAQGASNNDDNNRPVPQEGAVFSTHLDGQPDNPTLTVNSISAEPRTGSAESTTKWRVDVEYANNSASGGTSPARDLDKHPTERRARFRTEQLVVSEPREFGAPEINITWPFLNDDSETLDFGKPLRRSGTFSSYGPITDASGRRVPQVPQFQRRLPLFVMRSYTLNPFSWIELMEDFTDDLGRPYVNSVPWDLFGQRKRKKIKAGRCMFFSAETSDPQYWGSVIYYDLTVKVLYDKRGHDILVKNEGNDFWAPLLPAEIKDESRKYTREKLFANGLPVPPPILLNEKGELRKSQTGVADLIRFRDLPRKSFAQLARLVEDA